jgi:hypothetical protein
MVTSPYKWKILERNVKQSINKQNDLRNLQITFNALNLTDFQSKLSCTVTFVRKNIYIVTDKKNQYDNKQMVQTLL